jgi:hypothetical protein
MPPKNTFAKVMSRVDIEIGGCWHWITSDTYTRYGQVNWNGKLWYAHRLIYTILVSPITDGLEMDHLCLNKRCVNPAHLEPVTHRENGRRAARDRDVANGLFAA